MSSMQKLSMSLVPKSWAKGMEEESKVWKFTCSCGHKMSVWELGGIRWKAAGNPKRHVQCAQCGKSSLMTLRKEV